MQTQNYDEEMISKTIKIAWESQRSEIPETIEGKILHDAYVLEGGKKRFRQRLSVVMRYLAFALRVSAACMSRIFCAMRENCDLT